MALIEPGSGDARVAEPALPRRRISLGRRLASRRDPARARARRPLRASSRRRARRAALARPWPLASSRAARRRRRARRAGRSAYRVPRRRGRGAASDPRRPGARRNHRARPFPLSRQRRDRGAARGTARLCPQGRRRAVARRRDRRAAPCSPAGSAATARSPMPSRSRARSEAALGLEPRRARPIFAARWPNSSGSPTTSATSAPSATMPSFALMQAHCAIWRERILRAARSPSAIG